jgi:hypothetical protein
MYILDVLLMDVKYNVALLPLSHLNIKYEMFAKLWSISIFSKWSDKDLVFKDWIMVCVFLKGCKDEIHKCHWTIVLSCCISFKTHLSTLKLA